MKRAMAVAGLALAACSPSTPAATKDTAATITAPLCMAPIRKEIALTSATSKDVFELAAIGADCREATVLATVRNAAGVLIWSHADMASQTMAFAGIEQTGETPSKALDTLLQAWAQDAAVSTTADAPDWPEGAQRPESQTGLYYGTDFSRDDYLAVRKEARPMLCHPIYMNRTQCVAYYSDGAYATEYFDMRS